MEENKNAPVELEMSVQSPESERYENRTHTVGQILIVICLAVFISFPFLVSALFGEPILWNGMFGAIWAVMLINVPTCIIEYFTYVPILGTGASYLAFITGNILNLKLPCAVTAREFAKVEQGTEEGDIVSTISVGVSSITTILIIAAGVLMLTPLTPLLESPTLQPGFSCVLPALFGALGIRYFTRDPKLIIAPLAVMLAIGFIFPTFAGKNLAVLIFIAAIISVIFARILFKKGAIK